ncbi:DUF222 domain-containing protein [Mycolicibacterium vaccae]|uniref:HNH endonuclease signature motif containing protein n=1 Tax=Mycolicibacterium vaccae TaxID=1810 RepID=UPI003CF12267
MTFPVASAAIDARLEVLFAELAELAGQRNAIDGRIVEIAAEIDRDQLYAAAGARSVAGLLAWKTGASPTNAKTIATLAHRSAQFPRCVDGLRTGRLSLDQVGAIAERAADGSDQHYAEFATNATVSQLRTALKLEPRPEPEPASSPDDQDDDRDEDEAEAPPEPEPSASITTSSDEQYTYWHIRLPHSQAATFDAALQSHRDALVAQWKRDHDSAGETSSLARPPLPGAVDAFFSLIEAGWDAEAARRPHGQHTTVVLHVDVADRVGALHLGPVLTAGERQYLSCDATCEVWFHRDGQVIGAGRSTRVIGRRLRRALEHRDRTCAVPGCGATRGLHAHHIRHWEDGGATDLDNLVLLCPYHHRAHHRGAITVTGPAHQLVVTDAAGRRMRPGSLARPPTRPPPDVPPYRAPSGEPVQWWWYTPFEPGAPTNN